MVIDSIGNAAGRAVPPAGSTGKNAAPPGDSRRKDQSGTGKRKLNGRAGSLIPRDGLSAVSLQQVV
ncbi:MAG: hypothetical protein LBD55_11880 [Treponema sp.]|jgi:hypothetical protein|nr:hypothetical protein [Treponema sp.]